MLPEKKSFNTDLLINFLIGSGDGLIVPLALLAGLTAAGIGRTSIINTGLPVIAVAAFIMGIGGYLTRKNAELQPKNFVRDELNSVDRTKTRSFFANLGMTEDMQDKALTEMDKDDAEWKNFIDQYDLDPSVESPQRSGLFIGLAYALAGIISLLPFILGTDPAASLLISFIICLPLMFLLGSLKGWLTGQRVWISGLKLFITGAVTILAAYSVVKIFIK
ncbi:MAG: VIT1/CCC1 transporter family protein [Chitinophagaceae bacterium]